MNESPAHRRLGPGAAPLAVYVQLYAIAVVLSVLSPSQHLLICLIATYAITTALAWFAFADRLGGKGYPQAWAWLSALSVAGLIVLLALPARPVPQGFAVEAIAPKGDPGMRIHVRLFAIVRERAGISELDLALPEPATVAGAIVALRDQVPSIDDFLARCAFAVNQSYAQTSAELRDGDELAIIPPVSGG